MALDKGIDVKKGLTEFIKMLESNPTEEDVKDYYSRWEREMGERYVTELRRTNELYVNGLKKLKRIGQGDWSDEDLLPAR